MLASIARSTDDGRTWQDVAPNTVFTNGVAIAPVWASNALAWPAPRMLGLALTTDGGEKFRTVFQGPNPTALWAGYVDPSHAFLIATTGTTGQLWRSKDGGVSWT